MYHTVIQLLSPHNAMYSVHDCILTENLASSSGSSRYLYCAHAISKSRLVTESVELPYKIPDSIPVV